MGCKRQTVTTVAKTVIKAYVMCQLAGDFASAVTFITIIKLMDVSQIIIKRQKALGFKHILKIYTGVCISI